VTLTFSRFVAHDHPDGGLIESAEAVKEYLSSAVDPDDDPRELVDEVTISYQVEEGGTLIVGTIPGEPCAPYLDSDYDPELDDRTVYTFAPWKGPR